MVDPKHPPDFYTETRTSDLSNPLEELRPHVLGLIILAHPDSARVGEVATLPGLLTGNAEPLSRQDPLFAQPGGSGPFRPLAESHLSRKPWKLEPLGDSGGVRLQPAGSRTRIHLDGLELEGPRDLSAHELEDGVVLVLSQRVALLLTWVDPLPPSLPDYGLVGASRALTRVRQQIQSAAALDVPVLLRGETGTGKELVASALHQAGNRRDRPFVAVNMGTLSPSLAAAELFGNVKGAYTGADRTRPGLFLGADGGTLFLDEIGEAPPEVQVMLLRVLEDHQVQPVGGTTRQSVDVRIVAATDAKLEQAMEEGRFRAPLLHRLAGLKIDLPPLRQRRDDIPRLLVHFIAQERASLGVATPARELPASWMSRLVRFDWPGNVRQLRNVARQQAIAQHSDSMEDFLRELDDLLESSGPASGNRSPSITTAMQPKAPKRRWFRKRTDVSEDELLDALKRHGWQLRPTADHLGVSRATLYRLIDDCPRIRKAAEIERSEIETALAANGHDLDRAAVQLRVSPQGLKRRWKQLQ